MARCVILFFQYCPLRYGFSCNLDSKFCLHGAGGIYVNDNFINSGGNLSVSGSSAENGGAVPRSSSRVFGRILRWRVGSGGSTPWSEITKH